MTVRILTFFFLGALLVSSAAAQALPRTSPRTVNYQSGERSISYQRGITLPTAKSFFAYMTAHYGGDDYYTNYDLYRLPNTTDQYFATAYDGTKVHLLHLRLNRGTVSQVNGVSIEGCGLVEPFFFTGRDRLMLIVSNMAPDGGFCGNWVFEYRDSNWSRMSEIEIYDGRHGVGAFQGHSPIEAATAKFENGKYYLTLRGQGTLYSFNDKVVARRGQAVTYYYDGSIWKRP